MVPIFYGISLLAIAVIDRYNPVFISTYVVVGILCLTLGIVGGFGVVKRRLTIVQATFILLVSQIAYTLHLYNNGKPNIALPILF